MKKNNKVLAIALSFILIMSMPVTASAATKAEPSDADPYGSSAEGPTYPKIKGSYKKVDSIKGVKKGEKEFVMQVEAAGHEVELYLSFPSTGGFRLNTSSKGWFEPESAQVIDYHDDGDDKITMKAKDGTTVVFKQNGNQFQLSVLNGAERNLFRITPGQIAFSFESKEVKKVRLELPLADGESIYGTGERFNELDQVGKRLLMWNVDAGYNNENAPKAEKWRGYKNIPIIYSNRGYTLFFNSFYSGSVDVGYTNADKYTMEFQGPDFDFFVWTGTPKENISGYTSLTGTTLVLPKWAFSFIPGQHSSVWESYGGSTLGTIYKMQDGFKKLGTPNISAVYVEGADIDDARLYNALKKTGTKLLTWNSPDYSIDTMKGFLPGVDSFDLPITKSVNNPLANIGTFIDFTNPLSNTMLKNRIENYGKLGWAGGLLDFGELIPLRALFQSSGKTGEEMHNMFPYWEGKVYSEVLAETMEDGAATFSRAGCAGVQSYTAFFTGDQTSGMYGMRMQLIAGLSGSTSGLTMWGADLGGLDGTPSKEEYARAVEFSAFQPLMRSHGSSSRFPWDYGKVGEKTYQKYFWLRENLVNTIYSANIYSNQTGIPLTMPLAMEYPGVEEYDGLYTTYLFCNDFLVTPVLEQQAYLCDVVFPQGNWYGLYNGERVKGGETKQVEAPIDGMPVYIKAGSTIPVTVADSLNLTDSMQDVETTEALVITVPDEERENEFWKDEDTCVKYTSTRVDDNTFAITAGDGNDTTAVILKGSAAYAVTVDGTAMERLEDQPASKGKAGYFCEDDGQTIINLGKKDWKRIEISLGEVGLKNVLKTASVSNEDMKTTIDGDFETKYVFSNKAGEQELVYTLPKKKEISNILVKWTDSYSEKYKVSVSTNGSSWKEVLNEEEGFGGIRTIDLEGTDVKYIKIHDVERKTGVVPALYEVEAYETAQMERGRTNMMLLILVLCLIVLLAAIAVCIFIKKKKQSSKGEL